MSGETALRERAQLLDELRQIVQSMKNLAFAELQRVSHMKQAQTQARDAVLQALQNVLVTESSRADPQINKATWLVIGAERGFCGAFNTQLALAMNALRDHDPSVTLLVASHRLLTNLDGVASNVLALPGCAASEEADLMLNEWLDAVNKAIYTGGSVWLMYVGSEGLMRQCLWPFDAVAAMPQGRVAAAQARTAPQIYLPAANLRQALIRQALRLAIQGALYTSLAEENHWRLAQMQRAQDHLDELGRKLRRRYATLRQANITNELETLANSTMCSIRS